MVLDYMLDMRMILYKDDLTGNLFIQPVVILLGFLSWHLFYEMLCFLRLDVDACFSVRLGSWKARRWLMKTYL